MTKAQKYVLQEILTFDKRLAKYFSKEDLVKYILKLKKKL